MFTILFTTDWLTAPDRSYEIITSILQRSDYSHPQYSGGILFRFFFAILFSVWWDTLHKEILMLISYGNDYNYV